MSEAVVVELTARKLREYRAVNTSFAVCDPLGFIELTKLEDYEDDFVNEKEVAGLVVNISSSRRQSGVVGHPLPSYVASQNLPTNTLYTSIRPCGGGIDPLSLST